MQSSACFGEQLTGIGIEFFYMWFVVMASCHE